MKTKEFIDATVFMGMHSKHEETRIACKNFFVQRTNHLIYMSFENVGKCDDLVWPFDRITQDVYYPFMDRLHTFMRIKRLPYSTKELHLLPKPIFPSLNPFQKLTLLMVIAHKGKLYTFDKKLLSLELSFISKPALSKRELSFKNELEKYYSPSLALRL